jgi:hypothetical protein
VLIEQLFSARIATELNHLPRNRFSGDTGRDCVASNANTRVFPRHTLGQHHHGRLAGGIDAGGSLTAETGVG